ncbi:MAG: hypothetical protein K6E33_02090 [Lachnospiraceae bacterium]|nr:hypothetical protein [Lachnospiraceae bacterium]
MEKKATAFAVSLVLAVSVLSGCGEKSTGQVSNSTTVAESQVPVETEGAGGVSVQSEITSGSSETDAVSDTSVSETVPGQMAPAVAAELEETGLPESVTALLYSETPGGISLSLMMVGEEEGRFTTDGSYTIKHYDEDNCFWCDIACSGTDAPAFGNYTLDKDNRIETDIDWKGSYGMLSPGIYRFCSSLSGPTGIGYTYGETFLLSGDDENDGDEMPAYSYSGDDPVEQAITEYFSGSGMYEVSGNSIDVVSPVIFKTEEKGDETLIWGTFWNVILKKQGKVLYNVAGGENSGVLHLVKKSSGYSVKSFDRVQDGSDYDPSWKEMCGDDEKVYSALYSDETRQKIDEKTVEMIRQYTAVNDIQVTTLYFTGHEPVVVN